ncbi:MAG: hypothetical protein ACRCSN_02785 [Dermatophilaceae bacterium]
MTPAHLGPPLAGMVGHLLRPTCSGRPAPVQLLRPARSDPLAPPTRVHRLRWR